jgi:four helix bundle protein
VFDLTRDFRKLDVWKNSYALSLRIYSLTSSFPDSERFGLTNQLRRAASSIPANIAEGCGRGTNSDFLRFLYTFFGSLKECETFLLLARDLGYIPSDKFELVSNEAGSVGKMLNVFIDILKDGDKSQKPLPRSQKL